MASPVTDRGSYIDKAVDDAVKGPAQKPVPKPTPAAPPKRNKAMEDAEAAIYGPKNDDSTRSSHTGSAGQSSDAWNGY